MVSWQPLRFEPVYRDYLWGGRRLEAHLHKQLGSGPRYAESWEVVDHGADQSVVADGPLAGMTLHQLVAQHGPELLGAGGPADRFPLLFKFLDAQLALSLQVHPDDQQAAQLDPPDLGKTEAWVIIHAEPDAVLYAGLSSGVTQDQLREALRAGECVECMHQLRPKAGDCIMIPAGTPHALGAGLLVAEIQQSSDTTYRLHDWNRLGPDGRPRALHIEQGLAVIDYQRGPVSPQTPQPTGHRGRVQLAACDKFVLDRWTSGAAGRIDDQRFRIFAVLDGQVRIAWGNSELRLSCGQTTLLPAALPADVQCLDGAQMLEMRLP